MDGGGQAKGAGEGGAERKALGWKQRPFLTRKACCTAQAIPASLRLPAANTPSLGQTFFAGAAAIGSTFLLLCRREAHTQHVMTLAATATAPTTITIHSHHGTPPSRVPAEAVGVGEGPGVTTRHRAPP